MNILQASPLTSSINSKLEYGSIERLIQYLDREFILLGHDSYIVSDSNSIINGKLIVCQSKNNQDIFSAPDKYEIQAKIILDSIEKYKIDIVHLHGRYILLTNEFSRRGFFQPFLVTLHGILRDIKEKYKSVPKQPNIHYNAVSIAQKNNLSQFFNIEVPIYNGIPVDKFPFSECKEDYLFSFGRIADDKGVINSIQAAKKSGLKLVIGGVVFEQDRNYYQEKVRPHIDGENVIFVGPLKDKTKKEFYKNAKAFLMPIEYEDPCPLTVLESLACGTPVIAYAKGSLPELVKHGKTGYIVNSIDEMVEGIQNIEKIEPFRCREYAENHFASKIMAQNYIKLYAQIVQSHKSG